MPFIKEQLRGFILPSRDNSVIPFWVKISIAKPHFLFYKIVYLVPKTFLIVTASVKATIYFVCIIIIWQTSRSLFQMQGTCRVQTF